jgi:hypothetical protein
MAVVFPDDFNPEFAGVDPAVVNFWITVATPGINSAKWLCAGEDPDIGVMLKASHLMKEAGLGSGPAAPAGSITSESRGGKSVTRATGSAASGPHGSTTYGLALDNILATVDAAPRRMPPPPQPC